MSPILCNTIEITFAIAKYMLRGVDHLSALHVNIFRSFGRMEGLH